MRKLLIDLCALCSEASRVPGVAIRLRAKGNEGRMGLWRISARSGLDDLPQESTAGMPNAGGNLVLGATGKYQRDGGSGVLGFFESLGGAPFPPSVQLVEDEQVCRELGGEILEELNLGFDEAEELRCDSPEQKFGLLGLALLCFGLVCEGCEAPAQVEPRVAAEAAALKGNHRLAAELWYEIYRTEDPKTPRPFMETAGALFASGDEESACAMLDRGLIVFPGHGPLLLAKARLLLECGFQRAAEAVFLELLAVDPESREGLAALGRLRLALGNERAAMEPLKRLVELGLADAVTHAGLGRIHAVRGQPILALRHYSRAIELGSDEPAILIAAARLAADSPGAAAMALDWLERFVAACPQDSGGHFLRGELLIEAERPEEALVCLRRAVETDPGHMLAVLKLARLLAALGDGSAARSMAQHGLAQSPDPAQRAILEALLAE